MSAAALPLGLQGLIAALLLTSGVFTLAAAWGLVRLSSFYQRMHPPALVYVWSAWCVTLASILFFSAQHRGPQLHVWLIIILLSIPVPITTVLLSRAALFRHRVAGRPDVPPPLQPQAPPGRDG